MIDLANLEKRLRVISQSGLSPTLLPAYVCELLPVLSADGGYLIQERDEWTASVLYSTNTVLALTHFNPDQVNHLTQLSPFFWEPNFIARRSLKGLVGHYSHIAGLRLSTTSFKGWLIVGWRQKSEICVEEVEHVLYRIGDKVLLCTLSYQQIALDQQYQFLFGVVPQAVVLINEAENTNWINQAAQALLNLKASGLRTSTASLSAGMLQLRNQALNKETINQTASELIHNPTFVSKEWIWTFPDKVLSVFTKPILSTYFKGRIWLFTDVTEFYSKHQQLAEAHQEIENLLSVIAHDLKSPLSTISFVFSFLPMIGPLNAEQNESIEHGQKTIRRGLDLIDSIVYFNKLASATDSLETEDIELTSFIQTLVDSFAAQAYQKEISICVEHTHPPILLHTDPKSLARILDNLVSNALKFSPFGRRIYVQTALTEQHLSIGVQDEGPGISAEDRLKLFKRFQRLSAQPTNNEGSSGLGLSIVNVLTQNLGATIEVASTLQQGTTFQVQFPRALIRLSQQDKVEQETVCQ